MTIDPKDISKDVKMDDLRAFLKAKRGRASELAAFLGVPRPQLSNWLHGRFSPGADVLNRMKSWRDALEAQEAIQGAETSARLRSAINALRGR